MSELVFVVSGRLLPVTYRRPNVGLLGVRNPRGNLEPSASRVLMVSTLSELVSDGTCKYIFLNWCPIVAVYVMMMSTLSELMSDCCLSYRKYVVRTGVRLLPLISSVHCQNRFSIVAAYMLMVSTLSEVVSDC